MRERTKENVIPKHSRAFRTKCKCAKEYHIEIGPIYSFAKWLGDLTNIHAFHIFYKLCSPSNHLKHCWKFPTNWEKYSPQPFLKVSEEVRLDTGFLTCGKCHIMFPKEDGKRCVLPNHTEFLGWEEPLDLWPGCELPEDACLNAKRTPVTCFFCFDNYSFTWKEKKKNEHPSHMRAYI